jgi:hypothetical protein
MPSLNSNLAARFNLIPDKILDENFLGGRGLGNEISFYVFDYPPSCELEMRAQLGVIGKSLHSRRPNLRVLTVNLFDLVTDYLRERKLWDKALEMQREKGNDALKKPLEAPLKADKITDFFKRRFDVESYDVLFLTGVGSVFPLLRSHSLLNNLHAVVGDKPLVLFFPGEYDGQRLRLFNEFLGENYYRAFRLVP